MPAFDAFLQIDGVKGEVEAHRGGVNVLMGDGSVRFARADADSFTFTAAPGTDETLLLPAIQAAREAARAGDGSVMPQDEKGIIAVLIGLMDEPADRSAGPRVIVFDGETSGDDVVVDGRIITAETWDY